MATLCLNAQLTCLTFECDLS